MFANCWYNTPLPGAAVEVVVEVEVVEVEVVEEEVGSSLQAGRAVDVLIPN